MNLDLISKVSSFVEVNNMFKTGDTIIAGISGGADSVCLLFLLCELRKKHDFTLHIVHINHGIRGEAVEDEKFVENLCENFCVPCTVKYYDVPKIAKDFGLSEEEAGRKARYEAFDEVANSYLQKGINKESIKISVAHNMNDNAETVLFHLLRGSGIKGLTGIAPVRENEKGIRIVRPLLCLERTEIEQILKNAGLSWVNDATNDEDEYARNRIRHHILPAAEMISNGALRHIVQTAGQAAQVDDLLDKLSDECLQESAIKYEDQNKRIVLDISLLGKYHEAIISRAIFKCLGKVTDGGKDIGELQVRQIYDLIKRDGNRKVDLARGVKASRSYFQLIIESDGCDQEKAANKEDVLVKQEILLVENIPGGIEEVMPLVKGDGTSTEYTKWLDYDKINGLIQVRNRKTGDYLVVQKSDGRYGKKSVKDYMIDRKIPANIRDEIPVVAVGDKCIWLVGYRTSDDCLITKDTKRILKLTAV